MSHLLHVTRLQSKAAQRKGVLPLMLEYNVPDETAPYLVSSSTSVLWIPEAHPGSVVKAAVRQGSPGEFFREVIDAVATMGQQQEWGNVHPLTLEGLQAAIDHVAYYEMGPLELLTPRAHPSGSLDGGDEESEEAAQRVTTVGLMPQALRPLLEEVGLPFRPSAWLPENVVVVVPKDRSYVGVLNRVTPKKIAAVVHNAARSIGIAQGAPSNELAGEPPGEPDPG